MTYSLILSPGNVEYITDAQVRRLQGRGLIEWKRCHSAYVPARGKSARKVRNYLKNIRSQSTHWLA